MAKRKKRIHHRRKYRRKNPVSSSVRKYASRARSFMKSGSVMTMVKNAFAIWAGLNIPDIILKKINTGLVGMPSGVLQIIGAYFLNKHFKSQTMSYLSTAIAAKGVMDIIPSSLVDSIKQSFGLTGLGNNQYSLPGLATNNNAKFFKPSSPTGVKGIESFFKKTY